MNLINKMLHVHFDGYRRQTPTGFHLVMIRRVIASKRNSKITGAVISMFNSSTGKWDGRRVSIVAAEWQAPGCGVRWHGKVRPMPLTLEDGG